MLPYVMPFAPPVSRKPLQKGSLCYAPLSNAPAPSVTRIWMN